MDIKVKISINILFKRLLTIEKSKIIWYNYDILKLGFSKGSVKIGDK